MESKPILFLDVDGVLNAFDINQGGCDHVMAGRIDVWVPHNTKERIRILADRFEIRWCTAWFGSAHPAFRVHLDLPEESWPYVKWNQYKLTEILKEAGDRPWAWADDDIDFELEQLGWGEDTHLADNTKLIRVNPNVGLADTDVADLIRFAGSV